MAESKNGDVQRYMYNGKELDRMHGLDAYDYGARMYDANLTVWYKMDNLCEEQPNYSPYSFCNGNPINLVDSDGNLPTVIVGAVVGGVSEYGSQVVANFLSGKSVYDSMYGEVDFADVGFSAAEGALTGGASVVRKGIVALGATIARNAIDLKGNEGLKVENNPERFTKNMAVGIASSAMG